MPKKRPPSSLFSHCRHKSEDNTSLASENLSCLNIKTAASIKTYLDICLKEPNTQAHVDTHMFDVTQICQAVPFTYPGAENDACSMKRPTWSLWNDSPAKIRHSLRAFLKIVNCRCPRSASQERVDWLRFLGARHTKLKAGDSCTVAYAFFLWHLKVVLWAHTLFFRSFEIYIA